MSEGFDFIIVGGGAAGCVLANRLSASARHSVLLLEAGRDTPPGDEPADVLDVYPTSYYNKAYMWPGLRAHWRTQDTSPAISFDQGRIMGGGSSVMGMVALRGTPADYEEWQALGARGWGWDGVLPYFRKLETDLDFDGDLHGTGGPTPIRRLPQTQWTPLAKAIHAYAEAHQLPTVMDVNADFRDGYTSTPMSNTPERRASAAISYLDAPVRRRRNLTIIADAHVQGLVLDGTRVIGVDTALAGGERKRFLAHETILAAGALQSPAMLLRAGIGPAASLQALGIAVHADRRGVGANLQNHPVLFVGAHLKRHARQSPSLRTLQVTGLRLSSGVPGCPPTDLYFNLQSKSSWNALGEQIANLGPVLWKPFSRGRVTLPSARGGQPLVEFNFLSDERDLRRIMIGFRRVVDIIHFPEVRALMGKPFPVRFTDRLRRLNQRSRANALRASLVGRLLQVSPPASDWILARLTGGADDLRSLVADDTKLAEHILANVAGTFHVCGTCRMGEADDPEAVVDASGRVYGVEGLRVADASVMPMVPRANTNIPTIMVAEKLSATIADGA